MNIFGPKCICCENFRKVTVWISFFCINYDHTTVFRTIQRQRDSKDQKNRLYMCISSQFRTAGKDVWHCWEKLMQSRFVICRIALSINASRKAILCSLMDRPLTLAPYLQIFTSFLSSIVLDFFFRINWCVLHPSFPFVAWSNGFFDTRFSKCFILIIVHAGEFNMCLL